MDVTESHFSILKAQSLSDLLNYIEPTRNSTIYLTSNPTNEPTRHPTASPIHYNKVLTTAFWLGTEGTGHHLFNKIWHYTREERVLGNIYVLAYWADRPPFQDRIDQWLRYNISKMMENITYDAYIGLGIDSHPAATHNGVPRWPNFTSFVERWDTFNRFEQKDRIHLKIRSVVMKRHLASTVASAIHRNFSSILMKPQWHWEGLQKIEQQLRSASQDQWIMLDYEEFLLRPKEYAGVLAQWFGHNNVEAMTRGLGHVKVRSPERNILNESWQEIRDWDRANSNHSDGPTLEQEVQRVMKEWEESTDSIWNNECVVVSPEHFDFIQQGFRCF